MGSFIVLYGIEETKILIDRVLKGEDLGRLEPYPWGGLTKFDNPLFSIRLMKSMPPIDQPQRDQRPLFGEPEIILSKSNQPARNAPESPYVVFGSSSVARCPIA